MDLFVIFVIFLQKMLRPQLGYLGKGLKDWLWMHVAAKKDADLAMFAATRIFLKVSKERAINYDIVFFS